MEREHYHIIEKVTSYIKQNVKISESKMKRVWFLLCAKPIHKILFVHLKSVLKNETSRENQGCNIKILCQDVQSRYFCS